MYEYVRKRTYRPEHIVHDLSGSIDIILTEAYIMNQQNMTVIRCRYSRSQPVDPGIELLRGLPRIGTVAGKSDGMLSFESHILPQK